MGFSGKGIRKVFVRNYIAASTFELKEESEKGRWDRNRVRRAMNLDAAPVGWGAWG